jgi:hypothetical protein
MELIIKELDTYKSLNNRKKTLKEYIIYLMYENTPIKAYIEYGQQSRDNRIKELNILNKIKNNNYFY